jgi:hypothetical protein
MSTCDLMGGEKWMRADGSYLFCWFETGREEVAVIWRLFLGDIRTIHIHEDRYWRTDTLIIVHNHIIVKQMIYKQSNPL